MKQCKVFVKNLQQKLKEQGQALLTNKQGVPLLCGEASKKNGGDCLDFVGKASTNVGIVETGYFIFVTK